MKNLIKNYIENGNDNIDEIFQPNKFEKFSFEGEIVKGVDKFI